ncbi:MAG: ATP-binding protein [Roseiflexaceae bacterium]
MLAPTTPTGLSVHILTDAARLLAGERPFAARVQDLLAQLRSLIRFRDGRLTCWPHGDGPHGPFDQFFDIDGWREPWDEPHMRMVAERRIAAQRLFGEGWAYAAPITWSGHLWGVLELRTPAAEPFQQADQELVLALLPILAGAIAAEYATPAATQRRTNDLAPAQQRAIREISSHFEEPTALETLLATILHWALSGTGAEAGAISLVDQKSGRLVLHSHEGYGLTPLSNERSEEARQRPWDSGAAKRVAESGRTFLLRDVSEDPRTRPGTPEVRAEVIMPIIHEAKSLAVLQLDSPRSLAFGEGELAFLRALCHASVQPLRRAMHTQTLLEASTQLGQVFTSMLDGLALLDTQGRVLRYNPAWMSRWGLGPIELDQSFQVPWDLVPHLLPRLQEPLALTDFDARCQQSPNETQTATIQLKNPHQELSVMAVPTRDSFGQLTGRMWIVSDVTREREAERMKNEFISVVSHELRTPLTSILGYTELLLARDFAPKEQKEFVKTVYDEASHLSQIVEDLLGVSRLESGRVKLNQWVVSMRQLIQEIGAQINIQATSRHRIMIDMPQQIPPAYVDRDKAKQILLNLLTNAIKYSPKGGEIVLSVMEATQLPEDHPPGRWLMVSITDQGIGIAEEDLPRIWERFYRVDNSNTRRIGGTGLGLSIVRSLVELHGGRVWATSQVNKGSTFTCTFPIATEIVRS